MNYQDTCSIIDAEFAILDETARDRIKGLIVQNRLDAFEAGLKQGERLGYLKGFQNAKYDDSGSG